jgi:hypothetical protein
VSDMASRNVRHNLHPAVEHLPPARPAGVMTRLWRLRSEIVVLVGAVSLGLVAFSAHAWLGLGLLTGLMAAPATLKGGRSRFRAHFGCIYSRHRMQRLFLDTPLHTRSGRIPLILWITPTTEGEKALVLCRTGICAESFEAFVGELAAACGAMTARVARHRKWSNLVTIEIVRRVSQPMKPAAGVNRMISGLYSWEPLGEPYPEPPPNNRPDQRHGYRPTSDQTTDRVTDPSPMR